MHALRTLSVLTISPLSLPCSACRHSSSLFPASSSLDLRPQCPNPRLLFSTPPSAKRPYSTLKPPSSTNANHTYSYRVAASFSGKGRHFNPKQDSYSYNAELENLEGPFTGRPSSGQDAFFTSRIGNSSNMAFGVADGVGGWSDSGFDSAHFSHGLCQWLARTAETASDQFAKLMNSKALLHNAYQKLVRDGSVQGGGSTACVAVAKVNGQVSVANLGDSGYVHLRHSQIRQFSNPQTHAFNTPYQLSIVPPRILTLSKYFGGGPLHDMPNDALESSLAVQHGDVLVFATDGVWDNLTPDDVLAIVKRQMRRCGVWKHVSNHLKKHVGISDKIYKLTDEGGMAVNSEEDNLQTSLAVGIAGEAKVASEDVGRDGPFAKEIRKRYPDEEWRGGKVDDICVVVAVVLGERRERVEMNERRGQDGTEDVGAVEDIGGEEEGEVKTTDGEKSNDASILDNKDADNSDSVQDRVAIEDPDLKR